MKTKMPPNKPKVNQLQRKYLQDRLSTAYRDKDTEDNTPMPPDIAAAKKARDAAELILERWYRQQRERSRKLDVRVKAVRDKVTQVILFGTPDEALKAVEEFERYDPHAKT